MFEFISDKSCIYKDLIIRVIVIDRESISSEQRASQRVLDTSSKVSKREEREREREISTRGYILYV